MSTCQNESIVFHHGKMFGFRVVSLNILFYTWTKSLQNKFRCHKGKQSNSLLISVRNQYHTGIWLNLSSHIVECWIVLHVQIAWENHITLKPKQERKEREKKSVLDLSSTYRNKYKGFFTKETTVIKFVSSNPSGERRA